jgi:lysophospholipase L1-like esterase
MSDHRDDPFIRMILEPGTTIDLEAVFASPESREMRRAGEERMRVDWPYLSRYREFNEEVRRGPTPTLVLLGDSITENWRPADPDLFASGELVNRGIGGQVSAQLLVRFTPDVVRLRPRAVHLMVGTNDLAGGLGPVTDDDYQGHVSAMLDLADTQGIRVILGSILPAATIAWAPGLDPVAVIARWNAWLRDTARERGLGYADYFSALADEHGGLPAGLGNDGVHPNRLGYAAMRPILEAALAALALD